jgi:hypothetical protein
MFLRIWFLYLQKLGFIGFALCVLGLLVSSSEWGPPLKVAGMMIVIPLGILGALITIPLLFFKRPLRCPACGEPGEVILYERHPGIECVNCGIVYCKNLLTDFHVTIEPWPEEDGP